MPLRVDHRLFNCAAVVGDGRVLGVVPKTYLPNYGEFYEARQFQRRRHARVATTIACCGARRAVRHRPDLRGAPNLPLLKIACEICEDVWVPIPPSSYAALAGATVLVNLSASNITIGKSDYRHRLVSLQSSRCLAAYLYSSAGLGESTTDLGWDGQALIYESGELLAESERFVTGSHLHQRRRRPRARLARAHAPELVRLLGREARAARCGAFRTRAVRRSPCRRSLPLALQRKVERFPYVPADPATLDERCMEVYNIQVNALLQRLDARPASRSSSSASRAGSIRPHALLVCAAAMDRAGLPRSNILAYTMPGFATTTRTLEQAKRLMAAVRCTAQEIDIRPSCLQMLADIGHPFAAARGLRHRVRERAGRRAHQPPVPARQLPRRLRRRHRRPERARARLVHLRRRRPHVALQRQRERAEDADQAPGALGRRRASSVERGDDPVLDEILATADQPGAGARRRRRTSPSQSSEASVGPYELQDFHLY